VRLKGSSTFEDLDCGDGYCKAGFKIKLDEYVEGQKYGSLQRVTLNNMTTDYSQSKEVVVYDLLHRHGQLASRCSYARVTLNGEAWGLYANLESADDEWLERRFGDTSGNFWGTGDTYGDFVREYIDGGGWVLKSGDGDMTILEDILHALDVYTGDFEGEFGPYINVDQFLEDWGWCAALGNFDGYPFVINDVLIYADPLDGGRLVFAPWGTDESWNEYEYTGQTWNVVTGRLGAACLADPSCVAALKVQIRAAVEAYESEDVIGMAEAAWALSEADARTDPRRPYGYDYVQYYRDYYAGVLPTYGAYVRQHAGL
jgi:spore coat protein CotH